MQDTSSSCGGWPKKSKLVVEEGVAMVGSTIEDGFSGSNSNHNVSFGNAKDRSDGSFDLGSDSDGDEEHKP